MNALLLFVAIMPLPFDDSSLAPAGLETLCALPTQQGGGFAFPPASHAFSGPGHTFSGPGYTFPIVGQGYYNARDYGVVGDGVTDDTVALRNLIIHVTSEVPNQGIIYLPTGTYAVCRQPGDPSGVGYSRPIFNLSGKNNIVFIGDGPTLTIIKGYYDGLTAPASNWQVTGDSYWKISRFTMFYAVSATSNVQWRSMTIDGQAGYTGDFTVGGNTSTGDGWDLGHKAFQFDGSGTIDNLMHFNCVIENFRGEELYAGGTFVRDWNVVRSTIKSSNASIISAAANLLLHTCTVGSSAADSNRCYNGLENFCRVSTQGVNVVNSSIYAQHYPIAYLGFSVCSATITNTTLQSATASCLLLSEVAHHLTVTGGSMTASNGLVTSILGLYPTDPTGFSDINLNGVSFTCSGGTAVLLQIAISSGTINNCTMVAGDLLGGSNFTGDLSGITLDNNTINTGCKDVSNNYSGGNSCCLWTNTHHPVGETAPHATCGNKFDSFSGSSGSFRLISDRMNFNSNTQGATPFPMTLTNLANIPDGATAIAVIGQSNFTLAANATWNNFGADVPVTAGLTIRKNATTHKIELV